MANLIRTISDPCPISPDAEPADAEHLREWIITNGLGGYASGTVCGLPTRRYHGFLIAALPAPLGRTIMLNQLLERLVYADGRSVGLGVGGPCRPAGAPGRMPDRRVPPRGRPAGLAVRGRGRRPGEAAAHPAPPEHGLRRLPAARRRRRAGPCSSSSGRWCTSARTTRRSTRPHPGPYRFTAWGDRYEISVAGPIPPLRMMLDGREPAFTLDAARTTAIDFRLEAQRGYAAVGRPVEPRLLPRRADGR